MIDGCRIAGATTIIAVDTNEQKKDIAYQAGATDFLCPQPGDDLVSKISDMTQGGGKFRSQMYLC